MGRSDPFRLGPAAKTTDPVHAHQEACQPLRLEPRALGVHPLPMPIHLRLLTPADAAVLKPFRLESLRMAPDAFHSTPGRVG